ncbi:class I SAM-dependent methyltransferase [Oryzomonas sagensis]|uniref:Class I SAM-dependent methyltransferase n=1 Tax=Oryzomonas sagensis TaxID=2603857 RepID=A0ABQ6TP42_9BACT|nr:class I SAM-dependent methyltransferase [Oryzomonas sagensis]KAB0670423.1 class I SAM-dependent methyltransferase [Oryzomonas sagensis]
MFFTCRVCGKTGDGQGYRIREMFYGSHEEFDYVQCPSCRCLQIATIPTDMGRFYPSGYYAHSIIDERSLLHGCKAFLRRQRNRYLLFNKGMMGRILCRCFPADFPLWLFAGLDGLEHMAILDVGCGSGRLPYQLKEAGIKGVLGIDLYIEKDIVYGNGLSIKKQSLPDIRNTETRFDLIMFNHSFEHMPEPEDILKTAASVLTDSGTVLIRIPTVDSLAWEHYRENWVQIDAPRHLYLHSRASLDIVAAKAGLRVAEVVYDSDSFQFWGSEQYLRNIPLESERSYHCAPSKSIFTKRQICEFQRRAVDLNRANRGDMAAFHLRKLLPDERPSS